MNDLTPGSSFLRPFKLTNQIGQPRAQSLALGKRLLYSIISIFNRIFVQYFDNILTIIRQQAGAELGQAQLKLGLGFTC